MKYINKLVCALFGHKWEFYHKWIGIDVCNHRAMCERCNKTHGQIRKYSTFSNVTNDVMIKSIQLELNNDFERKDK